jgi:6-phosphogluconate dehydrogenase
MVPAKKLQLGVIGLGTMGANIARNAAKNGATVAVYNRTTERTKVFLEEHGSEGKIIGCESLQDLRNALTPARVILLMVKAGDAVDGILDELLLILQDSDIIIDGGNSHFMDTQRREERCRQKGVIFLGMGISGGEEGALHGPSLMPGGSREAVESLLPLLQKMAADDGEKGKCVSYLGPAGAGHFVKMVHNGIEYGLMQIIAESYDVLKTVAAMRPDEFADMYASWNNGPLKSFLIEITAKIFKTIDPETGGPLIEMIRDSAGQKGTGKWTTEAAMNVSVAIPTITAAVDARMLSRDPAARRRRNTELPESLPPPFPEGKPLPELARNAVLLSVITAYLQGFDLLNAASREYQFDLPLSEVARIWRGGCIIRSGLLPVFQQLFSENEEAIQARVNLFECFRGEAQEDWRRFVTLALDHGVPVPAISASLAYYDTIRRQKLPQNLVQAQRDFFGAHTYERIDHDGTFHTEWDPK